MLDMLKVSASQTIDVNNDITSTQNLFQQALEKIGSYKNTDYQNDSVILKGKSRYGLQGVPLFIQLDKTSETTTKVTIGGKSDDVGGVGAKKCIDRLISTFNTLNSNDTQQIEALESKPSFERKTGFSKMNLFFLIAGFVVLLIIVMKVTSGSSGPAGKSWYSEEAWAEYSFGDTYGEGDDFLNYNKQIVDAYGNPVRNIHRTGTFSIDGNTINCKFNDGQPPYRLEYKKVNGDWAVVDDNGNVFTWDDPANRKIK